MGTLTANQSRLPEYCEHKLPTSCRLSSIPNCCACADERAHAASYSTYIDGIGFVPRGTRWQRYCWFCKEFWEERVRVSGMRSQQTRIPEVPDQTEFLKRWYEFHQGYRIVTKEDGSEERVAVLGEEFRDVSPGCLPRTLEEMRAGRQAEEVRQVQSAPTEEPQEGGPSLDETLEQMFEAASLESEGQSTSSARQPTQPVYMPPREPVLPTNIHAQAMNPAGTRSREYQMRRVAALRRELNRMRHGIERVISGLRDLGEDVSDLHDSTAPLTALGETLDTITDDNAQNLATQRTTYMYHSNQTPTSTTENSTDRTLENMQLRVDEARRVLDEARRSRDQAANELDLAEQEFRTSQHRFHQLQREQRTTENYMRIFGTREEVIAQGENYESPIGGMFSRAEERFRAAEEVRREQRTLRQVLQDESRTGGELEARRLAELEARHRDVWGVPQPATGAAAEIPAPPAGNHPQNPSIPSASELDSGMPPGLVATADETVLEEYYAMLRQQDRRQIEPGQDVSTGPNTDDQEAENFPRNMLNAIVAARGRELSERSVVDTSTENVLEDQAQSATNELEANPPNFSPEAWWHQDANHIIRSLTSNDSLRNEIGMSPQEASVLLAYFIDDMVTENDRMVIDGLMRNPQIIWRTGLPSDWIFRRQSQGRAYPKWEFFNGQGFPGSQDWAQHYNAYMRTELVAQAYQMSGAVRERASTITAPERLQMLYRLQGGQRRDADVRILESMRDEPETYLFVLRRYLDMLTLQENSTESTAAQGIDHTRREMARNGDHSRTGLDSRRRDTTQAFALAAGRQAMETGSQALIERMSDRDEGTRAAYRRLENNNFGVRLPRPTLYRQLSLTDYLHSASDTDTDSDSDKEEDQARGLDAANTGRPEPKADEDLQVSMECKICYTQVSEVACLPCGHLVMCRWCSEQHSPCLVQDPTRPRRAAACPVCRKGIRQKVRVFRA